MKIICLPSEILFVICKFLMSKNKIGYYHLIQLSKSCKFFNEFIHSFFPNIIQFHQDILNHSFLNRLYSKIKSTWRIPKRIIMNDIIEFPYLLFFEIMMRYLYFKHSLNIRRNSFEYVYLDLNYTIFGKHNHSFIYSQYIYDNDIFPNIYVEPYEKDMMTDYFFLSTKNLDESNPIYNLTFDLRFSKFYILECLRLLIIEQIYKIQLFHKYNIHHHLSFSNFLEFIVLKPNQTPIQYLVFLAEMNIDEFCVCQCFHIKNTDAYVKMITFDDLVNHSKHPEYLIS